jgi:prolyl 4-hydroxylase
MSQPLEASHRRWHVGAMLPGSPLIDQVKALAAAGRHAEGRQLLTRLAGEGDGEALFMLGDMYWRGSEVEQDYRRGRELFRQSSDRGFPMAVRAYTNLLANGVAGTRDWMGAIRRLRQEAQGDYLRALMLSLIETMQIDQKGDPLALPKGEKLSESPLAILYRGAFSSAECDYLMRIAEPMYLPSLVGAGAKGDVRDPIRTSDGSTIHWLIEDPAVHALNRRLAALSGTFPEQGEALQILRYRPGQQYRRHFDWLGGEHGRVLTALVYLNEEYEGGETEFPKAGLVIRGRKGDALVFRSVDALGELDKNSEHAGLPVTRGTKYLASRWIRNHRHAA